MEKLGKADSNGHAMTGDKLLDFVNNTLFPVLKGNDVKKATRLSMRVSRLRLTLRSRKQS